MTSRSNRIFYEEDADEDSPETCPRCYVPFGASWLYRQFRVCLSCGFHYSITVNRWVALLADQGTFKEINPWLSSASPLGSSTSASYDDFLKEETELTGLKDAAVTGVCEIGGSATVMIVLNFAFQGGSLGTATGEKIALAFETAARRGIACVSLVMSSGVRVQDGILSLAQMTKTVIAVDELRKAGCPFISVLCNPSTGLAAASFVYQADVIFAEPGARIGFAALQEVQEASFKHLYQEQYSSEAFQNAGLIDKVVSRDMIKPELSSVLALFTQKTETKLLPKLPMPPEPKVSLSRSEVARVAAHPDRPKAKDYIELIFSNFIEIKGDRADGNDVSIICGLAYISGRPVVLIAQQRQLIAHRLENSYDSSEEFLGEITPKGLRKAVRAIEIAGRFRLPLVSLIDTHGFKIGLEYELNGLASAVSSAILAMVTVETPIVAIVIGEGFSEAVLPFSISDSLLVLENAFLSPLASYERATLKLATDESAQHTFTLLAKDLRDMELANAIVPEPAGGAHVSHEESAFLLKSALTSVLTDLSGQKGETLAKARRNRLRNVGDYDARLTDSLKKEWHAWTAGLKTGVRILRSGESYDEPYFKSEKDKESGA